MRRRKKRTFTEASSVWLMREERTVRRDGQSFIEAKLANSENGFVDTFRMRKSTFRELCDQLRDQPIIDSYLHPSGRSIDTTVEDMLAVYLVRVTQGLTFRTMEDMLGMFIARDGEFIFSFQASHTPNATVFFMLLHKPCARYGKGHLVFRIRMKRELQKVIIDSVHNA